MHLDVLRGTAGGRTVPVTKGLNSLSKVAQQVPAIGNLGRAWSALADAIGIGAGAIAGDNLDARAVTQPGGDGGSFAVRQQIDHLVRLKVHQHRAVLPSAPIPLR